VDRVGVGAERVSVSRQDGDSAYARPGARGNGRTGETQPQLPEYDFPDGDVDFVRRLAKGLIRSASGRRCHLLRELDFEASFGVEALRRFAVQIRHRHAVLLVVRLHVVELFAFGPEGHRLP
jgi:hypothetical protein